MYITIDLRRCSTSIFAHVKPHERIGGDRPWKQNQNIGRSVMSAGAAGGTFDPQQALSQHVLKNFYVGGEWVKPQSDRTLELVSPVTEECFLRLPEASEADVDRAV